MLMVCDDEENQLVIDPFVFMATTVAIKEDTEMFSSSASHLDNNQLNGILIINLLIIP